MRHSVCVDTNNGTPHVGFNDTPNTTTRPMMDVHGGDFDCFKLNPLDGLLAVWDPYKFIKVVADELDKTHLVRRWFTSLWIHSADGGNLPRAGTVDSLVGTKFNLDG